MSQGFTVKQTHSKINSGEHHNWYTSTFSKQTDIKEYCIYTPATPQRTPKIKMILSFKK